MLVCMPETLRKTKVFDSLSQKPDDPILALLLEARNDPSPNVVDLSAGVYKTEDGNTPIFHAIKQAEGRRVQTEITKSYLGIRGDERYNDHLTRLLFGENHSVLGDQRCASIQTIGGSGALFVAGRLLVDANPDTIVWAGDPTWGNHIPLLTSAGVAMQSYPYYDRSKNRLDFERMMAAIESLPSESVVLLHGCCHNPTGADLSNSQWDQLAEVIQNKGLVPFVDIAYHGLGNSLDEDAYGIRLLANLVPEMLVAYSCSKNFGVYRDRAGMLAVISKSAAESAKTLSNMMSISRATYSMPAAHGAFVVAEVLDDSALRKAWLEDLELMRSRINGARKSFVQAVSKAAESHSIESDFDFVANQFGMFSFLGISPEQVERLKLKHSIYMLASSRVNVAGLTDANIDYVAKALVEVLASSK